MSEHRKIGLMPPVFTPLNDDGSINYSVIPKYAKYLADSGFRAVLVGGTTGEHMSLSVAQRKELVGTWVDQGTLLKFHVQVQVGGAPFADVVELAKHAEQSGADSLLILPELYFKPSSVESLVFYLKSIAKEVPKIPIYYYHIPSFTHVTVNMPSFVEEATEQIPNFKGLKFTSNDLAEAIQVSKNLKTDQEIFLGADTLLLPAYVCGINSAIGTSFNIFPALVRNIFAKAKSNDLTSARKLQETLSFLIETIVAEGDWVPTMKAAMSVFSEIEMGPPCLPQRPISEEVRSRLAANIAHIVKEVEKYINTVH